MNAHRLAAAATVLVMLCGTAGASTMVTKDDPLAVPVSGQAPAGKRAADPWTPERQASAQPKAAAGVDPAAVRAASALTRSGREGGPQGATAAAILTDDGFAPISAEAAPGAPDTLDYWTPERLRSAAPMPMPELPADAFGKEPGPQNR